MLMVTRPRGTNDLFYESAKKMSFVQSEINKIATIHGFSEIRTPIFESTELFTRGIGEETDIVSKEMFTFSDRGGRSLTLRPENTAAVVRAYLENSLQKEYAINKLFYIGSMYRGERPQKGRYREFNQFGIECIGSSSYLADVETILLNVAILDFFNIKETELVINTVGCPNCKPKYNKALREALASEKHNLCDTCQVRYDKNILRMLDCKNPTCKSIIEKIPTFYDYTCDECREHFDGLCEELTRLNQTFTINPMLVRGLDYYTKTAFEIQSSLLGAQSAILGGGRYDKLVGMFNGGVDVPAVGSAMGIERLILMIENEKFIDERLDVFIIAFKETINHVMPILKKLRKNNIKSDCDFDLKSIKSQFKLANKKNAKYTLIIGTDEISKNVCKIRDMDNGEEKEVSLDNIEKELKNK